MSDTVKGLILNIKTGDQEAFRQLVDLYKRQVYAICFRMVGIPQEAEDLAQETFLRAYTHIDRYQLDKKFSTWLYRIATNLSIDYLRKRKPSVYLDADLPGAEGYTLQKQLPSGELAPDESVVLSEDRKRLISAIGQLPIKYRTPIVLKYIDDLSLIEMSDILKLPVATVKTRIHRGREALKKRLQQQ
jgi:RNA polymerase sigma-70 factor (ECF subfamily)